MVRIKQNLVGFLFTIIILIFLAELSLSLVEGQVYEQNKTATKQDAELALQNIKEIMKEMKELNFLIIRINDTLKEASDIYEAQKILEARGKKPDYSLILQYEKDMREIKENALKAKDELYSLKQSLNSLEEKHINVSEVKIMIVEIEKEIKDERYEHALELIPKARDKIAEIEASSTTLKVFYEATQRGIKKFFKENYVSISIIVSLAILSYIIFRKRIARYFLNKKILHLETEKSTLKRLIKETQKQYFEEGKIPEGIYNIRTKRFGEMIRDIDRQIPLLREQLAKLERRRKFSLKFKREK